MRAALPTLGRALAAFSTVLALAACDSASNPTAPEAQRAAVKAAQEAAGVVPVSMTIRGTVVDPSGRPLANAVIECLGDVQCAIAGADVGSEGHQHRITLTNASGAYEVVASSGAGTASFMMNANGQGYQETWQQVAWPRPACASSQPGCTLTVNFTLMPEQDSRQ